MLIMESQLHQVITFGILKKIPYKFQLKTLSLKEKVNTI